MPNEIKTMKEGIRLLNFTVGPVQSNKQILSIGSCQLPYFRTAEFSEMVKENETILKQLMKAENEARALFITGSGTASMEAAVVNMFDRSDNVLIINGGSFGQRFAEICQLYKIPYDEIILEKGRTLEKGTLYQVNGNNYTGVLVNMNETSTGVLYDVEMIGEYCKQYDLYLIVDAISSFIADELCMQKWGIDVVITGTQKALALPPGMSMIVLSKKAQERVNKIETKSYYLNLKRYLQDGERGQTPFTPGIGILLQLNARLKQIEKDGIELERNRIKKIADDFRAQIKDRPFKIISNSLSNAVTPLSPTNGISAYGLFEELKNNYDIFVCPNGGDMADKVFRVGHIGSLDIEDNKILLEALDDIEKRLGENI